jgi:Transglutaminase-like superfamily
MGAIDRWRRLTRADKRLVVRAAFAVAAMSLGVRILGLKRVLRAAEDSEKQTAGGADYADVVHAVERAGRYVPGGSCLTQSLALTWLLRKHGVRAETRIGAKHDNGFLAHAWVEVDGVPITSDSGYRGRTRII